MERRTDVSNPEIDPAVVDESRAVDLVLKAGDVSAHYPNIIHGSNPNTSLRPRCGLTIRYVPTSTCIVSEKPWPRAFLLRGKAAPGVNIICQSRSPSRASTCPFVSVRIGCEGNNGKAESRMKSAMSPERDIIQVCLAGDLNAFRRLIEPYLRRPTQSVAG